MKWLVVLAILCGAIRFSEQGLSREQIDAMVANFLTDCAKIEGASADELNTVKNHQLPKTRGEKCLHACIGETVGLIKDKKTSIEGSVEIATMAFGAEDIRVSQARDIATDCSGVTADDRCEAAVKMYECAVAAGTKRGLKFEELL